MTKRILRLAEVMAITGLRRSTIYEKMKVGSFPEQIPLGEKAVGWADDEVNNWVAERIAARNASAAAA